MRILALFFLLLLLPVLLFISLGIILSMGFPIIFYQQRIGKGKKPFTIYKFRSMKQGEIPLFGKFIRKFGLDEIPQLYNILKGEMEFVGPRPLTTADIQRLGWDNKKAEKRWVVKPGITGKAQLLSICDAELSLQNDIEYVNHKSFLLNLRIIKQSILIPFRGKRNKKRAK
jgi:lipopolysaccharide/colanic/teichoic acid biosynthesis glycosyltransferase